MRRRVSLSGIRGGWRCGCGKGMRLERTGEESLFGNVDKRDPEESSNGCHMKTRSPAGEFQILIQLFCM
jgi:hypothetical protein